MRKKFVLDTSVLLHDSSSMFKFGDNDIYIPLAAIGEVDKFKKGQTDLNVNARQVSRELKKLVKYGIPESGIEIPNGGRLFFLSPDNHGEVGLEERLEDAYADTIMLKQALKLSESDSDKSITILVTNDTNFLIRAKILGLEAEDYRHDKVAFDLHDFFNNRITYKVNPDLIDSVFGNKEEGFMPHEDLRKQLEENQYLVLKNGSQSCLSRYKKGMLFPIRSSSEKVGEIKPRNYSQRFLLDACLSPDLSIVSAIGKAGTGKTLLAIAAALQQVMYDDRRKYEKIIIFRPIMGVGGESLGYLPGDVDSKIGPYFRAIDTAIAVALGDIRGHTILSKQLEKAGYADKRITEEDIKSRIEKMPITYSRGDTYHHTFMIVDEAQNLKPSEIKMLGTRMGYGSKIVLTGDPFQIDNPYLDEKSNGLTTTTYKLRGVPEFAYVVLDKGERSREAEIFADKM